MTHMQNVNTYTLCEKQAKRGREGVWKITENSLDLSIYLSPKTIPVCKAPLKGIDIGRGRHSVQSIHLILD